VAEVFVEICQRGNPVLQGRPHHDLLVLGGALYRKAVDTPFAVAFTPEGGSEPIGLYMGWDMADGGAWDGISVPDSLRCHAAIGSALCANMPNPNPPLGRIFYGAFGGVCKGHPNTLFVASTLFGITVAIGLGFAETFGYTLHPTLLAQKAQQRAASPQASPGVTEWTLRFTDIDAPADVRSELSQLSPGIADANINDLSVLAKQLKFAMAILDDDQRKLFETVKIASEVALATVRPHAFVHSSVSLSSHSGHVLTPSPVTSSRL